MMRGMDYLMQLFLETRAYAYHPEDADDAHDRAKAILFTHLHPGKLMTGFQKAIDQFTSIPVDRSQTRIKIGITGDYYTRICDHANQSIFKEIESRGGMIMLPPTMSDFAKYDAYQKPSGFLAHGRYKDWISQLAARVIIEKKEKKIRQLFDTHIDYDVPLNYYQSMENIAPYMHHKLPPGLTGSIAAIIEQLRAGAHGILNLITFQCSYGMVISSIMEKIATDYPKASFQTLTFEGLKPTHNLNRLDAFMDHIAERKNKVM